MVGLFLLTIARIGLEGPMKNSICTVSPGRAAPGDCVLQAKLWPPAEARRLQLENQSFAQNSAPLQPAVTFWIFDQLIQFFFHLKDGSLNFHFLGRPFQSAHWGRRYGRFSSQYPKFGKIAAAAGPKIWSYTQKFSKFFFVLTVLCLGFFYFPNRKNRS